MKGLDTIWGEEEYGILLETGGGKERMKAYFSKQGWPTEWNESERDERIRDLHKLKTQLFQSMVQNGEIQLREGVVRLVKEGRERGLKIAVCSTSNENAVRAVVGRMGKVGEGIQVYAGDIVEKKKPAPDVYLLAAEELEVKPGDCLVVEDSRIGVLAGKAAGMKVVVTKSTYTKKEDFKEADAVFDSLDGSKEKVTVEYLDSLFGE